MEGVFENFGLPVGAKRTVGAATISAFEFSNKKDPLFNMRAVMEGGALFCVSDGKYVRLNVDGQLVMSDTQMERRSNIDFVIHANGKVLIAGLGIGLIIKNILPKLASGEITEITVIEKYQDVIDLVAPHYKNDKIRIICADIFEWKADQKYDTIYFDVWPTINTDNLEAIRILHNRFKNKLNRANPEFWMDSWMKRYLQSERAKERR